MDLFACMQGDPDLEARRRFLHPAQQPWGCLEQLVEDHDAAKPPLGASIETRDGFAGAIEGGQSGGFILMPLELACAVKEIVAAVAVRPVIEAHAQFGADPRDRLAAVTRPAVQLNDGRHAVADQAREAIAQRGFGVAGEEKPGPSGRRRGA